MGELIFPSLPFLWEYLHIDHMPFPSVASHSLRLESLSSMESSWVLEKAITMYRMYSRLELTEPTDRPTAIAGLERRLAGAIGTSAHFGVFAHSELLHQSLLWRRSGDKLLEPIKFKTGSIVPSWSWTAYQGAIDYLHVGVAGKKTIRWNTGITIRPSIVAGGLPVELKAPVLEFATEMLFDVDRFILDCQHQHTAQIRDLRCVIVGISSDDAGNEIYLIIIVSPAQPKEEPTEFKRLGIAAVRKTHIVEGRGKEVLLV